MGWAVGISDRLAGAPELEAFRQTIDFKMAWRNWDCIAPPWAGRHCARRWLGEGGAARGDGYLVLVGAALARIRLAKTS